MSFLHIALASLAFAVAVVILFVFIDLLVFAIKKIKRQRMIKKLGKDAAGLAILAMRLEEQRKTQLRMMKEADAKDRYEMDKIEEAQRDFE